MSRLVTSLINAHSLLLETIYRQHSIYPNVIVYECSSLGQRTFAGTGLRREGKRILSVTGAWWRYLRTEQMSFNGTANRYVGHRCINTSVPYILPCGTPTCGAPLHFSQYNNNAVPHYTCPFKLNTVPLFPLCFRDMYFSSRQFVPYFLYPIEHIQMKRRVITLETTRRLSLTLRPWVTVRVTWS